MAQPIVPLLRENYASIAKDLLTPLVDVLNVGRDRTGGDLDSLLIILVVALRTAEDRRIAGMTLEQVLNGEVQSYPSLTTNVRSIADSTSIPKETVRRKVGALIEAGWIAREDHSLALTPLASRMLTDVRESLFLMAVRNHQTVLPYAERAADEA
ncbi:hypothetical protein [Phenylobacterium deserti]|uniref:HTH iclR-type domain-containing protein n=1 Tax=Phenylobacterium deserti TaxID=1914756 RepID=A0A328AE36_9CAUL|nr:hypothetical protein [Phenylobacterium deserti]RAK52930.1 hypothetical protein DJ018_12195 [Phenylobacterium deserti]